MGKGSVEHEAREEAVDQVAQAFMEWGEHFRIIDPRLRVEEVAEAMKRTNQWGRWTVVRDKEGKAENIFFVVRSEGRRVILNFGLDTHQPRARLSNEVGVDETGFTEIGIDNIAYLIRSVRGDRDRNGLTIEFGSPEMAKGRVVVYRWAKVHYRHGL